MPGRYDAVFFDMGHTLVEFVHTAEDYAAALRPLGFAGTGEQLAASLETAIAQIHPNASAAVTSGEDQEGYDALWSHIYRLGLRDAGFEGDEAGAVRALWDQWLYRAWRVYDEVPGVLDRLSAAGYKIGIISNWPPSLDVTCESLGLTRHCPLIVCSAVVGAAKPDRRIFDVALERSGVMPSRAIHVGDSYDNDYAGAIDAGMDAALLVRRPSEDTSRAPARDVLISLSDLFTLLG